MTLNSDVLANEADVAARVGALLSGTTYTIYGLIVLQSAIQRIMNTVADSEQNELGSYYTSTDPKLIAAIAAYQVVDCAYQIILSLPGYAATFAVYAADSQTSLNAIVQFINTQAARFKAERDRAFNLVQTFAGSSFQRIDTQQPGYSSPSPSIY